MIYLVRHGESTLNAAGIKYGLLDPPLTPLGIEQAHDVAVQLFGRVTHVLTSPLTRARTFANLIAELLGTPEPAVSYHLIERSFGAAEGLKPERITERWPSGDIPGQETCAHAAARALPVLTSIAPATVVVAHAGVIKGLTGRDHIANAEIVEWSPTH